MDLFRAPSGSSTPFRTLELSATVSYNSEAFERLSRRAAAARGADPNSVRIYAADGVGDGGGSEGQYQWRIWWEPPARWREEVTQPGGQADVAVVRDGTGFVYLPGQRTLYTTEQFPHDRSWESVPPPPGVVELPTMANRLNQFPLIRPPLPTSQWILATIGGAEHAGRVTRRVRATRRVAAAEVDDPDVPTYWPWRGLDEYECLVDDELQILLRFTGLLDGEPVVDVAVDELRVDEMFGPELFAFLPSPGTRIVHVPR